jgi:hypothetical protein
MLTCSSTGGGDGHAPVSGALFGWDHGGVILDWKGGALARVLPGVRLYLDPGPSQYATPAYGEVLGDQDYASTAPAMQRLNPAVHEIFIDFE